MGHLLSEEVLEDIISSLTLKQITIHHVYRDPTGSLIGVVASRNGIEILLVSAYLPAKLDLFGYPEIWEEDKKLGWRVPESEVKA